MESWFKYVNFDLKNNNSYLNLYKYHVYNNYLLKFEICENILKTHYHIHDRDYCIPTDKKLHIYNSIPNTYPQNPQYYYVSLKDYVKLVEYKIIHNIDLVTVNYLRHVDGDNVIRGLICEFLMEMILKK